MKAFCLQFLLIFEPSALQRQKENSKKSSFSIESGTVIEKWFSRPENASAVSFCSLPNGLEEKQVTHFFGINLFLDFTDTSDRSWLNRALIPLHIFDDAFIKPQLYPL